MHDRRAKARSDDFYVDEDGNVTRCVCNNHNPRGFMLQCEECAVWQHGRCVGIAHVRQSPRHYFCERCRPTEHPYSPLSLVTSGKSAAPTTPRRAAAAAAPAPAALGSTAKRRRASGEAASTTASPVKAAPASPVGGPAGPRAKKRRPSASGELSADSDGSPLLDELLHGGGMANVTELGRRRTRNPRPTYFFEDLMAHAKAAAAQAAANGRPRGAAPPAAEHSADGGAATPSASKRASAASSRSASTTPVSARASGSGDSVNSADSATGPATAEAAATLPTPVSEPQDDQTVERRLERVKHEIQKVEGKALPDAPEKARPAEKPPASVRIRPVTQNITLSEMNRRAKQLRAFIGAVQAGVARERDAGTWFPISGAKESECAVLMDGLCRSLAGFQSKYAPLASTSTAFRSAGDDAPGTTDDGTSLPSSGYSSASSAYDLHLDAFVFSGSLDD